MSFNLCRPLRSGDLSGKFAFSCLESGLGGVAEFAIDHQARVVLEALNEHFSSVRLGGNRDNRYVPALESNGHIKALVCRRGAHVYSVTANVSPKISGMFAGIDVHPDKAAGKVKTKKTFLDFVVCSPFSLV